MRTYEYKLKPNKTQTKELDRLLWETKCLYNTALEQLIKYYEKTGKHLNRYAHDKMWNKKTCPELPAVLVDTTIARLHQSFSNFFRGIKEGKKVGFPRFQSYRRWNSFSFRDYKTGGKIIDGRWRLSRTNTIKVILHRPFTGVPKFTRFVRRADGYYVQVVCEIEKPKKVAKSGRVVGLDLGLKYFVADSDGEKITPPKFFRKAEYRLAKAQRKLSKKRKGSRRRIRQADLVAKQYLKVKRQRKDWLHKLSYKYATENDIVVMENLNVSGMARNKCLSKSISDAGWGVFTRMLENKLETLSRTLIKINPAYTSQICSSCGAIVKKSLSQRTHYCPECLYVDDRDVNASKTILKIGLGQPFGETSSIEGSLSR